MKAAIRLRSQRIHSYLRGKTTRRGMLVTIMVFMLGTAANTIAVKYWSDSHDQYMAVIVSADGFRARQLAVGGFQAGLTALKSVPEEFLYKTGLALEPPDIQVSPPDKGSPGMDACRPNCFISYRLLPEDGKLNLNSLIVPNTDEVNKQFRGIIARLFRVYEMKDPERMVDSIIDWIDENNTTEGAGAENDYYAGLKPPVKIKDFRMFNLSEVTQIKDIPFKLIYSSQAPKGWKEQQEALRFQTEEEKALIQEPDWIPANNLTAFIPMEGGIEEKVNVNAARYHVLMALSDNMTKQAAMALFKFRRQNGNFIKNLSDLRQLPEFQVKNGEQTLFDELVGSGTELSGVIKSKGEIYRLVGVGSIVTDAENKSVSPVIRKLTGLFDNNSKRLIYYSED